MSSSRKGHKNAVPLAHTASCHSLNSAAALEPLDLADDATMAPPLRKVATKRQRELQLVHAMELYPILAAKLRAAKKQQAHHHQEGQDGGGVNGGGSVASEDASHACKMTTADAGATSPLSLPASAKSPLADPLPPGGSCAEETGFHLFTSPLASARPSSAVNTSAALYQKKDLTPAYERTAEELEQRVAEALTTRLKDLLDRKLRAKREELQRAQMFTHQQCRYSARRHHAQQQQLHCCTPSPSHQQFESNREGIKRGRANLNSQLGGGAGDNLFGGALLRLNSIKGQSKRVASGKQHLRPVVPEAVKYPHERVATTNEADGEAAEQLQCRPLQLPCGVFSGRFMGRPGDGFVRRVKSRVGLSDEELSAGGVASDSSSIEVVRINRLQGIPDHNRGLFGGLGGVYPFITRSGNFLVGANDGEPRVRPAAWYLMGSEHDGDTEAGGAGSSGGVDPLAMFGIKSGGGGSSARRFFAWSPRGGKEGSMGSTLRITGHTDAVKDRGGRTRQSMVLSTYAEGGRTYFQWRTAQEHQRNRDPENVTPGSYGGSDAASEGSAMKWGNLVMTKDDLGDALRGLLRDKYGKPLSPAEYAEAQRRLREGRRKAKEAAGTGGDGIAGGQDGAGEYGEGEEGGRLKHGSGDGSSGLGLYLPGGATLTSDDSGHFQVGPGYDGIAKNADGTPLIGSSLLPSSVFPFPWEEKRFVKGSLLSGSIASDNTAGSAASALVSAGQTPIKSRHSTDSTTVFMDGTFTSALGPVELWSSRHPFEHTLTQEELEAWQREMAAGKGISSADAAADGKGRKGWSDGESWVNGQYMRHVRVRHGSEEDTPLAGAMRGYGHTSDDGSPLSASPTDKERERREKKARLGKAKNGQEEGGQEDASLSTMLPSVHPDSANASGTGFSAGFMSGTYPGSAAGSGGLLSSDGPLQVGERAGGSARGKRYSSGAYKAHEKEKRKRRRNRRQKRELSDGTIEFYDEEFDGDDSGDDEQLEMFLVNFPEAESHVRLRKEAKGILEGLEDLLGSDEDSRLFNGSLDLLSFSDISGSDCEDLDSDGKRRRRRRRHRYRYRKKFDQHRSDGTAKEQRRRPSMQSVSGFNVTEDSLRAKFRSEAEDEFGELVALRDQLRNEVFNQRELINGFGGDIESLSKSKMDDLFGDEYAVQLTKDVNRYAKENNLKLSEIITAELSDADIEEVGDGFLKHFGKGKAKMRDAACQVTDEDLGYVDEGVRRAEAQVEDLYAHERGLLQSIKLATIAVANIMSFHASLELESTCKECFYIFEHPRTLWPCGHTFCESCLSGMFNRNEEIICAECGSLCEVGYTPNLSIELVANYQIIQEATSPSVAGCAGQGKTIETVLRTLLNNLLATQRSFE